MNASGDRRYRRCKGSFSKVEEESVRDFGPFIAGFEEDSELNIEIVDSRLEKRKVVETID